MMQTTLLEGWLRSSNPEAISLPEFYAEANKLPVVAEAPVRQVSCHRRGVHEYLLVHCSVKFPTAQRPVMAYFRLERNPTEKSARVLSGKSNPAADTIRMNVKPETLHQQGSSAVRGYLVFNQVEDNPRKTLMLKHILDMYEYLAQESLSTYTILGTNCRWFCFGVLECLRECRPCFSGQWFECARKDSIAKQDTQAAIRAKNRYLKEKHTDCCHRRPNSTILSALVQEAVVIGAAVSNMVEIAGQAQSQVQAPSPTDPNVIYSTTGPTTHFSDGTSSSMPSHVSPHPISSGMPGLVNDAGTLHNSPATCLPHLPHHHQQYPAHPRPQGSAYTFSRPPSWASPPHQPNFETHIPSQTHYPQYGGVPGIVPQPNSHNWGDVTGSCLCPECIPFTPRSSMMSDHSCPPQTPRSHYQSYNGPPPHPLHNVRRFQPQSVHMNTLYGIPEGYAPDGGCFNCGHHLPPAPPSQDAFIHSHGRPGSVYAQDSTNIFMGAPNQNNMGPQTVYRNTQPRQPQPTRWFTQDSTIGVPLRTESPTQMTMDDTELN
ncbi:hypothetical protein FRC07_005208, partial [Ceratobasidium sp. 392]